MDWIRFLPSAGVLLNSYRGSHSTRETSQLALQGFGGGREVRPCRQGSHGREPRHRSEWALILAGSGNVTLMPSLAQNTQPSSRLILLPEFLGPPWYPHEVFGPLKPGVIPQSGVTGSCELIVIGVSEGQVISILSFSRLTNL